MNHDTAQGNWQQLSGKIKQKWGKLTDDDLMRAQGDKEYLIGKLHEQYGIAKDKVEDELQTLGYSEDDQDADLRSSDRSSAGRMDLAGRSGSGAGHTLEAGSKQGSSSPGNRNSETGSSSKSGSQPGKPNQQQKSGSNNPGGSGSSRT